MFERIRRIQSGLTAALGAVAVVASAPEVQPIVEAFAGAALAEYGPQIAAGAAILNLYRRSRSTQS